MKPLVGGRGGGARLAAARHPLQMVAVRLVVAVVMVLLVTLLSGSVAHAADNARAAPALVLYEHRDRSDFGTSLDNIRYFLSHGLLPPHRATFILVLVGCHSVAPPTDIPNVHIIEVKEEQGWCAEMGAWRRALDLADTLDPHTSRPLPPSAPRHPPGHNVARFSRVVLLSSRARGPFVPPWTGPDFDWLSAYEHLLLQPQPSPPHDDTAAPTSAAPVELVGPRVACDGGGGLAALRMEGLPLLFASPAIAARTVFPLLASCPSLGAEATDLLSTAAHRVLDDGGAIRGVAAGFLPPQPVTVEGWGAAPALRRACARGPPFSPHPYESLFTMTSTSLRELLPPLLTQEVVRLTALAGLPPCEWRLGRTGAGGGDVCAQEQGLPDSSALPPCLAAPPSQTAAAAERGGTAGSGKGRVAWAGPGASDAPRPRYRPEPATVTVHMSADHIVELKAEEGVTLDEAFNEFCSDPELQYEPVLPSPNHRHTLTHERIMSEMARERRYTSYLEVGCRDVTRFMAMAARVGAPLTGGSGSSGGRAVWVDAAAGAEEGSLAGAAFQRQHKGETFDLIFVEGSHGATRALADVRAALNILAPGGSILLKNANPRSPNRRGHAHARCCRDDPCGTDTFRAVIELRQTPGVTVVTGDIDYGLALIRHTTATTATTATSAAKPPPPLTPGALQALGWSGAMGVASGISVAHEEWEVLHAHRVPLLALVTVDVFLSAAMGEEAAAHLLGTAASGGGAAAQA